MPSTKVTEQSATRPARLHKKLGQNAVVSALLKNVRPLGSIKAKHVNDYKRNRVEFIVNGYSTQMYDG